MKRNRTNKATEPQTVEKASPNGAEVSLLNAAEALFADKEFDAVTTRDIANRAKVNLALVHYYFGAKEKLFRAVLERRIEKLSHRRLQLLKDRHHSSPPFRSRRSSRLSFFPCSSSQRPATGAGAITFDSMAASPVRTNTSSWRAISTI